MIQPETWKAAAETVVRVWSLVGPLAGVLVGAWLARWWDKRKWVNDNRKEEYRELVTALTTAAMGLIEKYQAVEYLVSGEKLKEIQSAYMETLRIIQDRIFIAGEMERMKIFDRWGESVKTLNKDMDFRKFEDAFDIIKKEIVTAATKY